MRTRLIFLLLGTALNLFAQEESKELVFIEVPIPGYAFDIYVQNPSKHVLSYEVKFNLDNYRANRELEFNDTIGPGVTKKVMFFEVAKKRNERTFSYDWRERIGNVFAKHEFNLKYTLPYAEGTAYNVIQGYDEGTTHTTIEALDFAMPIGTEVLAARRGLVVEARQDSNIGCEDSSCAGQANYVRVLHYDGTFGLYKHFKVNSLRVMPGDYVNIGEVLGLSGATGQVSEPQLHFQVDKLHPNFKEYITIPVKFTINDKGSARVLKTGDSITRPNNIQ